MTAEIVSQQDYDAALARVAAYREQLQRADRQADQNSLDRARDLELLYQAMRWVDEVPAPKNTVWRGRPVDPRSRNRFAGWMLQKTGLNPSTVRKLHGAYEIVDELNSCYGVTLNPTGAEATRPLQRLRRAGYGHRIGDVYKNAIQLAEGQQPTSAETRQAVRDFLAQFSRAERRTQDIKNKWQRKRDLIKRQFTELLDDGQLATAQDTLNDLIREFKSRGPTGEHPR